MKALTLTQPWCGLVASGIKRIENRPWNLPQAMIGQRIALHASRQVDERAFPRIAEIAPDVLPNVALGDRVGYERARDVVLKLGMTITSAILGTAVLTGQVDGRWFENPLPDDQRRWFFGPVGFVLDDIVRLPRPIEIKGALGFWKLPDDVERQVLDQLQEIRDAQQSRPT